MKKRIISMIAMLSAVIMISGLVFATTYIDYGDYNGATATLTTDLSTRTVKSTLSYTKTATLTVGGTVTYGASGGATYFFNLTEANPTSYTPPASMQIKAVTIRGMINGNIVFNPTFSNGITAIGDFE